MGLLLWLFVVLIAYFVYTNYASLNSITSSVSDLGSVAKRSLQNLAPLRSQQAGSAPEDVAAPELGDMSSSSQVASGPFDASEAVDKDALAAIGCCQPFPMNTRPRRTLYDFRGDPSLRPFDFNEVKDNLELKPALPEIY